MTTTNSNPNNNFGTDLGTALMRSTSDNVQMARMEHDIARSMGTQDVPSSSGAKEIEINQIDIRSDLQVRVELNPVTTHEYAQLMNDGIIFPPVTLFFDGETYLLSDGFYRVDAAKKVGKTTVSAVVKFGTASDAILFALDSNNSHGARLTNADKQRAVLNFLNDAVLFHWSNREIARRIGVSDCTVGKYRKQKEEAETPSAQNPQMRSYNRGGKTHVMNIGGKNKKPLLTAEILEIVRTSSLADDAAQVSALSALPVDQQLPILKRIENGLEKTVKDARVGLRRDNAMADKAAKLAERRRNAKEQGYDDQFICGDCTSVLKDLVPGSVRLLLADGPYGVNLLSNNRVATALSEKIENDGSIEDALDIHREMLQAIAPAMLPDCHVLMFCDKRYEMEFRQLALDAGYNFKDSLIWNKGDGGHPIPNQASRRHERIVWFTKGQPQLVDNISDVLTYPRPSRNPDAPLTSHPTPKPHELLAALIKATTVPGELVVDPFAGTASTLVTAKFLNRRYFGVELNENWFGEGQANLQTELSDGCSVATLAANSYQGETELAA